MYYIYGISGPSLLIESTDSMIFNYYNIITITILLFLLSIKLILILPIIDVNGVINFYPIISAGTLGFYLKGVPHPDGSTVLRTDIGEGDDALQCTTDREGCCYIFPNRVGQFFFPNTVQVPTLGNIGSSGYYRNRDVQLIRLNRQSPNGVTTGRFRCEIPSGTTTDSVLFINVGM